MFQLFPKFPNFIETREDSTHMLILILYSAVGSCFIIFQGFVKNEIIVLSIVILILSSFIINYFLNRERNVFYFSNIVICLLLFLIGIVVWILDQIESKFLNNFI